MEPKLNICFMLIFTIVANSDGACPAPENIYPCTCKKEIFECGPSSEIQQFQRAFENLKGGGEPHNIIAIRFLNYSHPFIPSGLFSGINVRLLVINTSELKSFTDNSTGKSSFLGIEDSLVSLRISFHSKPSSEFEWGSLHPLRTLYDFSIGGTFTTISQPFPSLPTVNNFWIQNTDIRYMVDKAFAGLTGVKDLRMMDNKMETYSRNFFAVPSANTTLFITQGDNITTLPEDYFEEMPVLKYVQIPAFCHNIPPLKHVGQLNLQGSRGLTCDHRLEWLLRMRDEGKVNILHAICARPQNLYWRDVQFLHYEDLSAV